LYFESLVDFSKYFIKKVAGALRAKSFFLIGLVHHCIARYCHCRNPLVASRFTF